jgi:hypothetical protein
LLAASMKPIEHWVYSDGCTAQFKGAKAMYFVARYPGLTGCTMRWSFFGSGHGKGMSMICEGFSLYVRFHLHLLAEMSTQH